MGFNDNKVNDQLVDWLACYLNNFIPHKKDVREKKQFWAFVLKSYTLNPPSHIFSLVANWFSHQSLFLGAKIY